MAPVVLGLGALDVPDPVALDAVPLEETGRLETGPETGVAPTPPPDTAPVLVIWKSSEIF